MNVVEIRNEPDSAVGRAPPTQRSFRISPRHRFLRMSLDLSEMSITSANVAVSNVHSQPPTSTFIRYAMLGNAMLPDVGVSFDASARLNSSRLRERYGMDVDARGKWFPMSALINCLCLCLFERMHAAQAGKSLA